MTPTEVLNVFNTSCSEAIKNNYLKQGASVNTYGVSLDKIYKVEKEINSGSNDQDLKHKMALDLWKTQNTEARILAVMLIEPDWLSESLIEEWVNEIDFYIIADIFAEKIYRYHFCMEKLMEWTQCDSEYIKRTGFTILSILAKTDKNAIDTIFIPYLKQIEHEIHYSDRFAREAMYSALIAIGSRNANLNAIANEAAAKIGIIQIDDGIHPTKHVDAKQELNLNSF